MISPDQDLSIFKAMQHIAKINTFKTGGEHLLRF